MAIKAILTEKTGKKFLFLMAAQAEYGEKLKQIFTPLFIGVGPVEAAVNTAIALSNLSAQNCLPDYVISLGSAGAQNLHQTGVYQVASVSWRDIDASAFGVEKGLTPFLDLPKEIELPCFLNNLPKARLSTGSNVVSGSAYNEIDADMVDMETYAVLRACQQFNLPLIGLRGISDGKHEINHIDDWQLYLHIIDEKLANCVDELLNVLAKT
ncbi:5'-methylthioadenosine/S-adenosylhomocysteine nucleosidase [Bartonella sp. HY038]|uniref:5'-methylthioadenosine/S-adenosylhomocysteine nucleosidase n=1 Tax=Bartonella sp. HY038 TaxID=2759660 RepID=UPI0015FC3661|nr:5'-methylthioadenosine/S-adenosylhomocysteine nucleosidase [Bartonella sp. HY038]